MSFQLGKSPQLWSDEMALRRKFLVDTAMRELTCGAKVVIFPESISGSNRRLQATEWLRVATAAAKRETTVLVGEETWNENRSGYKTHRALLAGRADLLVSAANQWPSSGTSAEIAQDTHRVLLARMAGVAILIAKNR